MNGSELQSGSLDAKRKAERVELLFRESQREVATRTDRSFVWLMMGQWLLGIFLAVYISPMTWIGQTSFIHIHVWFAVLFGGVLSAFPIVMAMLYPGSTRTRHAIAFTQGVWSAFLIHLTGGRIETHFHAFGSMAFLVFYRDWKVLVTATLVVVADHVVRGTLWPLSVYGVAVDSTYRFIEHAAWLTWLDVFLIASCFRHQRDAYDTCLRRAELECANEEVEEKVRQRTQELQEAHRELESEYAAREELYGELMTASRKAGMAEVATGVLHNVGNVLNSLSVSSQVLSEQIHRSPVDKLVLASEIVSEQEDLSQFLKVDERGRHFPKMLEQLSSRLSQDKSNQISEVNSLLDCLEHVQEVIGTQQVVARNGADVLENIKVESLVADAIRISGVDTKTNFEVVTSFEGVSDVMTDKHRVLQILINLLNNAEQAIRAQRRDGRIEIEVCCERNSVRVVVRDNGSGIAKEDMTKIFGHGFTTKADGHGFGLHSCALTAKALGGSLSAASEGKGLGAAFTLTLPLRSGAETLTVNSLSK